MDLQFYPKDNIFMKYLINYANETYRNTQQFNSWTGKNIAKFDRVIEYSDKDIDEVFYKENKEILDTKRGNGLWLWKPYIIAKTLEIVSEDDIIFYCDAGAFFFREPKELWKIMEQIDFWISEVPLIEEQFTKKMVLNKFDEKKVFRKENQFQACFQAVRKTERNIRIIQEWLDACKDKNLLAPPNTMESEDECFISHREDQSLLSLILKKNGINAHQDPTQYSRFPDFYWNHLGDKVVRARNDKIEYKPFIILHRRKRVGLKVFAMPFYYFCLPRKMVLKITRG